MSCRTVIALDGPSGTGKSTVARGLARRLGFRYLDTGAMYRAVTWAVLRDGVDPEDASAVTELVRRTRVTRVDGPGPSAGAPSTVHPPWTGKIQVLARSRSRSARCPRRRACARCWWRRSRRSSRPARVVAEGRDIGTVVAPAAPLKVFLTASPDARAHRRSRQDGTTDHRSTAAELDRRDRYDSTRTHSPLRAADDAVHVDSTVLSINEVVQRLVDLAMERGIVQEPRPGSPTMDAPPHR